MILLTKKSQLTGETNTMLLDITEEQLIAYYKSTKLIQDFFLNLSAGEREFIMTGVTPEEWTNSLGREE